MKLSRRYPAVVSYLEECPPKGGNPCRDYSPHSFPRNSSRCVQSLLTRRHLYDERKALEHMDQKDWSRAKTTLLTRLPGSERPGTARDNKQMCKKRPITKISGENL
jgi:hypothetical protein